MLMRSQPSVGNCNALKSYGKSFLHKVSTAGGSVGEGSGLIGSGGVKRRAGVEIAGCGHKREENG